MNDKEWRTQMEYRLKALEGEVGQLGSAFQIVWSWMIQNKSFCDKLPFSTIKPAEEVKAEEVKVEEPKKD